MANISINKIGKTIKDCFIDENISGPLHIQITKQFKHDWNKIFVCNFKGCFLNDDIIKTVKDGNDDICVEAECINCNRVVDVKKQWGHVFVG